MKSEIFVAEANEDDLIRDDDGGGQGRAEDLNTVRNQAALRD